MNKQDRRELQGYVDSLEKIKSNIETMMEDETEKLDNMPEGLQESERGEAMQNAIDQMEYGIDSLQEAIDNLSEILEGWPMEEITIKVTKALADRILEALKYRAAHVSDYYKDLYLEIHHIVKSQIENQ